jgi:hypothetical protein
MSRPFQAFVYLMAATVNLWPILMMAMSTAFGGVDGNSVRFLLPFGASIVATLFDALAVAAAFRPHPKVSSWVFIAGPTITIFVSILLAFTIFSASNILVSAGPQAFVAMIALYIWFRNSRQMTSR